MLKNGRPYTNENGREDGYLITDLNYDDVEKVGEWIRANVRKGRRILEGHTSYGLNHMLQGDTDVYLTNNQFKDAMWLAGFKPVNPDELNWRYRIVLTKSINVNPSPFFNWVKDNVGDKNDFKQDMLLRFDFPVFANHDVIVQYLQFKRESIEVFEELWKAYRG